MVGQPQLRLSTAACDPEWDRFLSTTPGGHHLQSSLWGQVKSVLGWRAVRIAAVCDGRIRGGAQLLLRRLPAVGSVGYVPLGPVLDRDDPALRDAVLRWVQLVGRRSSTRFLVVQPPAGHEGVVDALRTGGFREARWLLEPHPSATLLVDLAQPEEALLAAMKRGTRYNVRLAQRKGVTVREGSPADVATFHRLLTMTGERQGFPVPAEDYFAHLLRVMAPGGHAKVFLAEFDGRPVSAALVIAFGRLVSYKRGAWSGRDGHLKANELLQWAVIRWAKRAGYRYYDLEGIALPDSTGGHRDFRSVSAFKMGFGGNVVVSPGAYERIRNPVLRQCYYRLGPLLLGSPHGRWLVDTIRTR